RIDNNSTFQAMQIVHPGDWIGNWHVSAGDSIGPTGTFDAYAGTDFVMRSSWGMGIVTMSPGWLTTDWVGPNGTWLGNWQLGANDWILGSTTTGDFDGDGHDDMVFRSQWGIGIIGLNLDGVPHSLAIGYFGWWQGDWNLGAADQIAAIGNFTGDPKAELVLRSGWGLGILAPDGWGGVAAGEMHCHR